MACRRTAFYIFKNTPPADHLCVNMLRHLRSATSQDVLTTDVTNLTSRSLDILAPVHLCNCSFKLIKGREHIVLHCNHHTVPKLPPYEGTDRMQGSFRKLESVHKEDVVHCLGAFSFLVGEAQGDFRAEEISY